MSAGLLKAAALAARFALKRPIGICALGPGLLVAPEVTGEDGLPDPRPQAGGWRRAADDRAQDVVESPADLEEAGKLNGSAVATQ